MIGAGFMARGIANSILNSFPGMRLVAVANRTLDDRDPGVHRGRARPTDVATSRRRPRLEDAIRAGRSP